MKKENNEEINDIIEMLAFHEEALSNLYGSYHIKFGRRHLWDFLREEEEKHAIWLRSILDNVVEGSVIFDRNDFSLTELTESIEMIVDHKILCDDNKIKEAEAFDFAVKIENNIIEKSFLSSFSSDEEGIQKVIDDLISDTKQHREALEAEYGKLRNMAPKYIKNKQDEIQSHIEENDSEWIEDYKANISQISEEHAKLKEISESSEHEIKAFEKEKEKIAERIKNDLSNPEETTIEFEVYQYIGLHSQYERQLSNLYKLFENIFPDDELWPFMAEEERKHECWLKDIMQKMKEGTICFKKPSYNQDIVLKAIINISEIIHYGKEFKISHKEAYRLASDQENSMLEAGFFGKFSSDAPALDRVFRMLIEDTIEHRNWLKRRMDFYNY